MGLLYTVKYDFDFEIDKPNPYIRRIKMGEEYYLVKILLGDGDDYPIASIKKIIVMNFPNATTSLSKVKYVTIVNEEMDLEGCLEVFKYGVPTVGQTLNVIRLTTNIALCKDKMAVAEFVKFSASKLIARFTNLGDLTDKESHFRQKAFLLYKQAMTLVKKL